jgi:hypothetical protein
VVALTVEEVASTSMLESWHRVRGNNRRRRMGDSIDSERVYNICYKFNLERLYCYVNEIFVFDNNKPHKTPINHSLIMIFPQSINF